MRKMIPHYPKGNFKDEILLSEKVAVSLTDSEIIGKPRVHLTVLNSVWGGFSPIYNCHCQFFLYKKHPLISMILVLSPVSAILNPSAH
jgi:hypothetical protein